VLFFKNTSSRSAAVLLLASQAYENILVLLEHIIDATFYTVFSKRLVQAAILSTNLS
jgi:hypothetical protein